MAAVELHDNDPRIAGRASGRGTAFACQISTSASGTGRASWSSTRPTSARRSPRSNSGSSSESSGPASLGRGWWLRRCDCSGSPRLLKRQLPAWPTRRSCLAPSIFARRSLSPKCSGGPFSRGHGGPFSCCRYQTLNEGRGANPGDTAGRVSPLSVSHSAQRRPGREPRRHARGCRAGDLRLARSTKAGARTPATLDWLQDQARAICAQRRPGREPRRHPGGRTDPRRRRFAQRRPGREPRRHPRCVNLIREMGDAQRRPGREPRRHSPGRPRAGRASGASLNEGRGANPGDTRSALPLRPAAPRSTKAGAQTPATPTTSGLSGWRRWSLNEGRGANPGDTPAQWDTGQGSRIAQRRPGREPRRHQRSRRRAWPSSSAQRRPGREPRRHQPILEWRGRLETPLNEGRGANPGDTRAVSAREARRRAAQRRPGREPRRHRRIDVPAGAGDVCAQRRPGREPRRHHQWRRKRALNYLHAQRRPGREPRRHAEFARAIQERLRSTKAGARTPATPGVRPVRVACGAALNEGRGANPGDTPHRRGAAVGSGRRSTKAGARTPATPVDTANPSTCTTIRSTKAGARTPATRPPGRPADSAPDPLNEGRGANPGDTSRPPPA